jgi:molybdopterin-guanine dinucleotide biosynthesis protein A
MEYRGLIEISQQDIPLRGKYARIGLQAINDFQAKRLLQAKIDIPYSNETELKSLYNALKSIVRRKKLPIRVSIYKDKSTNKRIIYLTKESSSL